MNKDLSTFEWKEVNDWLQKNNMEKYIKNFQSFNVNGYDLCYLANEDFAEMSINNFHDKNIILRNIRTMTLEELKLIMQYEGRRITIQLDFEPSFTVEMLSVSLCELFHISNKIYLSTSDGEILMPNIKIVELILLNPQKYKQLKIITEKDTLSMSGGSNGVLAKGYPSSRIEDNAKQQQPLGYDEASKSQYNSILDNEFKPKGMKERYSLYDVTKKFEKNDIEKEYLMYKEAKGNSNSNNIPSVNNKSQPNIRELDRERDSHQYSKEGIISQSKQDQYKGYQDIDSYIPLTEKPRIGLINNKDKDQQGDYSLNNYPPYESTPKLNNKNDQLNQCSCYNSNDDYSKYDKASKSNINDNFRLPLPLDNIKKESSYSNYNNNSSSNQQKGFNDDNRKFSSEKRSFRSSDPNENDNELLVKPSEKYQCYNDKSLLDDHYLRKTANESMSNSQKRFDIKGKARPGTNTEYEIKGGLRNKGGLSYGERERERDREREKKQMN